MQSPAKKVAFILTPVDFGGAEKVSLTFILHHRRENITLDPILLCRPWETENVFRQELHRAGIAYHVVPTRRWPRYQKSDFFRVIRCVMRVYKLLREGEYDLVHTNGYFADIVGLLSARFAGLPIVTTCHGFISNTRKFRFYNSLNIFAIRWFDKVIAVSEKMKDDLVVKGIKQGKIEIVQNAVQIVGDGDLKKKQRQGVRDRFGFDNDAFVLGYVGRLSEEKGLGFLLEAAVKIGTDVPVRICVIGDGPQACEMKEFVCKQKLEDVVVFAGFQENVTDILPAFDVFVLPSLTEGTSMALLEAMACGLPVIATEVGGTPDVVHSQKNGLLVPPGSSDAIVAAIEKLYHNKDLRGYLGSAAMLAIENHFSIESWLEEIEKVYQNIIRDYVPIRK